MDCSEVKEFISAYYDDELSSDTRTAVAEHLAGCDDCARELEGFRSLSVMAEELAQQPEPPAHIWQQLEEQLAVEQGDRSERPTFLDWLGRARKPVARFGFAVAAVSLIAVGWFGYTNWFAHDADHQMAVVFGEYLEEFRHNPNAAQKILLANYAAQIVDAEQAVHTVGYRPAVADGMPEGYSVESTYVIDMPCCKCVQCNCKRSDGSGIAIFEHDDKDPEWFGDRPTTEAICNGTPCNVVDLGDRFAATWRRGKRHITVIGARNASEVDQLVDWFDDRRRTAPR